MSTAQSCCQEAVELYGFHLVRLKGKNERQEWHMNLDTRYTIVKSNNPLKSSSNRYFGLSSFTIFWRGCMSGKTDVLCV